MEGPRLVLDLADSPNHWTIADLEALPEDLFGDWRRLELLDGALIVSPTPPTDHAVLLARLVRQLDRYVPDDLLLFQVLSIDLGENYLVPDLLITTFAGRPRDQWRIPAAEVELAVEVVSRGSRTMDRITKPAVYAAAGVRHFWRVETEPEVSLHAYGLEPGASDYTAVGAWASGQVAELDEPFPVRIEVSRLDLQ